MRRVVIPERWERIISLVDHQGNVTVEQIAHEIDISPATVRRDLDRIEKRGLIRRTRGGAMPSPRTRIGATLAESRRINPTEKELIGRVAAELVESGDILMIDGGFTTYQVARHLQATDITVVTNSIDVLHVLVGREGITLVLLGGDINLRSGTTVGPFTEYQIQQFNADKVILGADAVSPEEGISVPLSQTAQTKKAMIEHSRELILVADYSKIGKSTLYKVAPAENISTMVTDDKADKEVLDTFRSLGVEVVVAGQDSQAGNEAA